MEVSLALNFQLTSQDGLSIIIEDILIFKACIKDKTMNTKIIGTGSYLPKTQMTNDDIAKLVDTSDEWIKSRTGIASRHISSGESTTDMAYYAARCAIEDAAISVNDIDLIIVATVSADNLVPSTACQIQGLLHANNAIAFDINAACSGFIFASSIADSYIKTGVASTALIIGVETLSKLVDWSDRSCCILFGDGAGAAILRSCDDESGIRLCKIHSDGSKNHVLSCVSKPLINPLASVIPDNMHLYMDGQEVFKFATKTVPLVINEVLSEAGLTTNDIDYFLLHQANIRIIQLIARKLGLPLDRFPSNLDECGNTSAASLPILLDECRKRGILRTGNRILLSGFGAGLTYGAMIVTL